MHGLHSNTLLTLLVLLSIGLAPICPCLRATPATASPPSADDHACRKVCCKTDQPQPPAKQPGARCCASCRDASFIEKRPSDVAAPALLLVLPPADHWTAMDLAPIRSLSLLDPPDQFLPLRSDLHHSACQFLN